MIETKTITSIEELAEHLRTSKEPVNVSEDLRNKWLLANIEVRREAGSKITPKWADQGGGIWRVKR